MKKMFVLLLPAVFSIAAFAQDTKMAAPTTPAVTATDSTASNAASLAVPRHKCSRPEAPGKLANNSQQKLFVKEMDGYRDCLMAYRNDMNLLAKAHVDAANGAVEEFNNYIATVNKK